MQTNFSDKVYNTSSQSFIWITALTAVVAIAILIAPPKVASEEHSDSDKHFVTMQPTKEDDPIQAFVVGEPYSSADGVVGMVTEKVANYNK